MSVEAALWRELAGLLPEGAAGDVRDAWDIGEQEAGLQRLVGGLRRTGTPIGGVRRAQVAVLAEAWGMWPALAEALAAVPASTGRDGLQLLDEGAALAATVPWIACTVCGEVLARVHEQEPWGEPSHTASGYAVLAARTGRPTREFGPEEVWDALSALRACGPAG